MFDSGDIVRLNRLEKREYLCNPNNKIFLMVSGYLTKRRDVRKSKFRRIALNPLTRTCYKIKSKRKFPASGLGLSIATMRIGKRIRIRQSIIDKVLEDGQNELGEICNWSIKKRQNGHNKATWKFHEAKSPWWRRSDIRASCRIICQQYCVGQSSRAALLTLDQSHRWE